ncbi:endo-1,4-beta-xylanase [Nocardia aurea]|uniref:endo-1,4-beta-xylanase n=1 Tax=Nocardia aurea TaxID=2144174 RepID=UPI000D69DE91|nr:endo-1,4-beta-xylanase [Nocardia aurea]
MSEPKNRRRERMTDGNEQLLRPIIARWCVNGVVVPDAFKLSAADKKDSNHLSIGRGSAMTPEQAYHDRAKFIQTRCNANGRPYMPPVGVYAVTVDEVESIEIKSSDGDLVRQPLTVWDDSMNDDVPDDHGHIDYNGVPPSDKGAHEFAAKTLLRRALAHGWKYGPVPG